MSAIYRFGKTTTAAGPAPTTRKELKNVEQHTNLQMLKVLLSQLDSQLSNDDKIAVPRERVVKLYPILMEQLLLEQDNEMINLIGKTVELMKQKFPELNSK